MIHRAILGSLERFIAIITENFAGKWPFWLNPKQVMVIPVAMKYADYANSVAQKFKDAGLFAEVDESANTLNKMIRNAQVGQWSFVMGKSCSTLPFPCPFLCPFFVLSNPDHSPCHPSGFTLLFTGFSLADKQSSVKKRWRTRQSTSETETTRYKVEKRPSASTKQSRG